MAKHSIIPIPKGALLYDPDILPPISAEDFEPGSLAAADRLLDTMNGRAPVYVARIGTQDVVLRHYRRGGALARFGKDRYLWTGLKRSRPFREWWLLRRLRDRGLPVPAPAAARVLRSGPLYRADLMTVRLPNMRSMADRLRAAPLPAAEWRLLGTTLRRFHLAGAFHADLNAMNILLSDQAGPFVIDWDRGRLRQPQPAWQRSNLLRLHRSLEKLRAQHEVFHMDEAGWRALLDGYDEDGD